MWATPAAKWLWNTANTEKNKHSAILLQVFWSGFTQHSTLYFPIWRSPPNLHDRKHWQPRILVLHVIRAHYRLLPQWPASPRGGSRKTRGTWTRLRDVTTTSTDKKYDRPHVSPPNHTNQWISIALGSTLLSAEINSDSYDTSPIQHYTRSLNRSQFFQNCLTV
jgi:hypothetical protein